MRLVFEALVVNLALILSFVYVVNRFKPWSLTPLSPLRERLLHGVGFGVLSGLIMEFSLVLGKVDYRYMPDYRYVPVIASGLLGGPAPALVAGLINSLWRLYMIGGEGMWIGVATSLMIGFLAGLFAYAVRGRRWLLWIGPVVLGFVTIAFNVLLPEGEAPLWYIALPFYVLGYPAGVLFIMLAIEDTQILGRAQADLATSKAQLEQTYVQLRQQSEYKSAFLSTMSHEMRTPLTSIMGYTQVLLDEGAGPLTAEQRQDLQYVARASQRLLEQLNDVLDLSRIEAGKLQLGLEDFRIDRCLQDAVALVAPLAGAKGLRLVEKVPTDLHVRADWKRTAQVLTNLLVNAVKFTDEGGITVTAERQGGFVEVAVTDTGIGIAPEALPHIFEEFRQADASHARRMEGSGLGLAIVRRLVELHGGRVEVESTVGRGSSFTFTLPAAPEELDDEYAS